MLTLYYSPAACSLSVHIALRENDQKFNLKKVNLATHKTEDDADFYSINHKGYVPTIILDNGEILTEAAAILFYIAEQGKAVPPSTSPDSFERYRLQEALTFVSSELHKRIGVFFNPKTPEGFKEITREVLTKRFNYLEEKLSNSDYITGSNFTVADAYCYTILNWMSRVDTGLQLADWPQLNAYVTRIANRPKVREALEAEGLVT